MALTTHDSEEQVTNASGFAKHQSVEVTESLFAIIRATMETVEDVRASGFGKLWVKAKNTRIGRNSVTGMDATLPARRVARFKCSGKLRDKENDL